MNSHACVWGAHLCIDFAQIRLPRKQPAIFARSVTTSGCDLQRWHFRQNVPGQQFIDMVNGVFYNAREHFTQVGFRI